MRPCVTVEHFFDNDPLVLLAEFFRLLSFKQIERSDDDVIGLQNKGENPLLPIDVEDLNEPVVLWCASIFFADKPRAIPNTDEGDDEKLLICCLTLFVENPSVPTIINELRGEEPPEAASEQPLLQVGRELLAKTLRIWLIGGEEVVVFKRLLTHPKKLLFAEIRSIWEVS